MSSTVTTAVVKELFPLLSTTVNVTVFGPTSTQVKLEISKPKEAIPHASDELLSTSVGTILTLPFASSCTVMSFANATGLTVSSTVTTAVTVALFPLLSVAVKVTVLGPTSAQVKLVTSKPKEAIPQASEEPLLISAVLILAFPAASN